MSGPQRSQAAEAGVRRVLVVVSHTHWDREWYQPFEEFRVRLVRMMDALLDLFARDPEFRYFVLDGQTVPLDDYLEVRPDRRPEIERLVREGRLLIGPNYVLPDEFLIGGEAHIRNLMTGIRSAREYGGAMMVGYAPDAFGHIAHLPAILRGFGIDTALIWRGVGPEATTSEFRWAAPDGSEVLVLHFPFGYGMLPVMPEEPEQLRAALNNVRRLLEPLATTRYVLVPNGTDHLPAHTGLSRVIRAANAMLEDAEMIHGNYPQLAAAIRRELGEDINRLPRLAGEFRNSKRSNILPGVLSTRMWLKQRYQECEDLLARYAEPAAAWRALIERRLGADPAAEKERLRSDAGLLRQAWRMLLQNGPHDSVTGCSVDAVYDDVRLRFQRCQQAAEAVLNEALHRIAELASPPGEGCVVVFNPEPGPRCDFCTVRLPVDQGRLPARLVDPGGRALPLQIVRRNIHSPLDPRERVMAGFVASDLPGLGYRAYRVEYGEAGAAAQGAAPRPQTAGPPAIENEYFRITADPSTGAVTVEDKASGLTYGGLNRFVDGGDRGDEYTYSRPRRDEIIGRPAQPASIRVLENGPARWTLEVRQTYALPARLTPDRHGRSPQRVGCEITSRISLYPGVPRVEIETEVDNQAEDHRLRVHFPTGIACDRSWAEQHFGVVQRPLAVPEPDWSWLEAPVGFHPQKAFVDISDGERGFMLANRGLPEYEAMAEDDGGVTIALTLLRCVGWLSRGDLDERKGHAGPAPMTPGAQMKGRWRFHYCIIPHQGGWEQAYAEAHRFLRPLRAVRTTRGAGRLPLEDTLMELGPAGVVPSALKLSEDAEGVVLRVYNILDRPVQASIRFPLAAGEPQRVNLNEEDPSPLRAAGGEVSLPLRSNEIATLRWPLGGGVWQNSP